jgi:hypothetical protein
MDQQELLNLLRENLKISVFHPQHDTGYYGTYMEEDAENVTVRVYFGDELICEDSTEF